MLVLCNHFAGKRGTEGEILAECLLTMMIANKAYV